MGKEMKTMKFSISNVLAKTPTKAYSLDAGFDLRCLEDFSVAPYIRLASFCSHNQDTAYTQYLNCATVVDTGIKVAIPEGHYGRIASKSGLAVKGIEVGAGVVDIGFTGNLKVILRNFSRDTIYFKQGDKIAQLIITPIWTGNLLKVDHLDSTERNQGGFGSSGR